MEIRKLKKGFIFSLFVITAMALIVTTYRMRVDFREEQRAEVYSNRVSQTNIFIEDMEKDMERALYVTSFRAFLGADEYIHSYGEYIDDVNQRIPELILYGTIDGEKLNTTNASTFMDWANRIAILSNRLNINISFKDIAIELKQSTPWTINVSLDANISVVDFDGIIGWNISIRKNTIIDISKASFPDPIYFIESIDNTGEENSPLLNRIEKSPFNELWVNEGGFPPDTNSINVTNLINHTINQFYWNNTRAPSYLMRLEGNFSNSTFGIESLVNVINNSNIWDYAEGGAETCAVDYQFFVTGCVGEKRVYNMNDRFYLDEEHIIDYGMEGINST